MNPWPAMDNTNAQEERLSERHRSAYQKLRSALIRYEFRPGERLMITDLAICIGVSQTPIREALSRLREEMLIEFVPGRGYFCPVPDLKVLTDLYQALAHLVIFTFDDMLGHQAPERIDGVVAGFDASGDVRSIQTEDVARVRARLVEEALRQLVALGDNQTFSRLLDNILARTHTIRCLMLESPERFQAAKAVLHELQEAQHRCDREAVKGLILSHTDMQISMLPGLITELIARRYIDSQSLGMSKSA